MLVCNFKPLTTSSVDAAYLFAVPEYDITHPVQLNEQGDFLSRDLSHDKDQDLYVGFSAFGQDLHLKLTSNTDRLLAEDFITEIRNNGETRLDRSVDRCHYLGHVITAEGPGEKVALSNCDGLVSVICDVITCFLHINKMMSLIPWTDRRKENSFIKCL